MDDLLILKRFIDEQGKVKIWPAKHSNKDLILNYLIAKFDPDTKYSEQEVNELLKKWHTFEDWAVLRRALIDGRLMVRDINGYEYKVSEQQVLS